MLACILASLHSHILRFMCAYLYPRILASSYFQVHVRLLVSSHPCVLTSSGYYILAYIPASLYPHVRLCLLISLDPHIFISSGSCACFYTCILTSSDLCALVGILTSSYPHVYVCLLVCSHLQANVFSIRMNNCILALSSSLVLGNCASQFVNNLQILRTGQACVLDFYRTRRKIYRKQPLRADLKKKLLKSR